MPPRQKSKPEPDDWVPATRAEEKMNPKYRSWSKQRRFEAAAKAVVYENHTYQEACDEWGVSKSQLVERVKALREKAANRLEQARVEVFDEAGRKVAVSNEKRRVGTFEEFDKRYFSNMICFDCEVHHETPGFHKEIIEAVDSGATRLVVNMPPGHAKSTTLTLKHTLYDICRDPNSMTIIVSKSNAMAKKFLMQIQQHLTNPALYDGTPGNLVEDWGPFQSEGLPWSAQSFYVAGRMTAEKDPTVQALGVGNQIYGARAHRIKFDDIATLENQRNPDQVQKMLEWIDKEALSRIGNRGQAVWAGTRVAAGDIYSYITRREGYKVLRYPLILDESNEITLWPDHMSYDQAVVKRGEMTRPGDFQLIYQNVDMPGTEASFPQEIIDQCKDTSRVVSHMDSKWRIVAGLDPAGAKKKSGFTAMVVMGLDLSTDRRYLIDIVNERSMPAPRMKDKMRELTERYRIQEWRVEVNGVQDQIMQYDQELLRWASNRGCRIRPHVTGANKWDSQFGTEAMAPLLHAGLVSIPWANQQTARTFYPLVDQLLGFPMAQVSDVVMAFWFAELACKDMLKRQHLPMFNERMRVPARVKRRRHVVDFEKREVRRIPIEDQRPGYLTMAQAGYRRTTVGRPVAHEDVQEFDEPARQFVNIATPGADANT